MASERKTKYSDDWKNECDASNIPLDWIKRVFGDQYKAHCIVCNKSIKINLGGLAQLKNHATGDEHINAYKQYKSQ